MVIHNVVNKYVVLTLKTQGEDNNKAIVSSNYKIYFSDIDCGKGKLIII